MRATRAQLLIAEERCAEEKRHQVIDRPVREERAQECFGGDAAQNEQHHRLEDANASRHVAHDSGDDRDGVRADEGDELDVRAGWQQPPEHRAREGQIHHAERHLRQSDGGARRAQRPAAYLEHAARERRP